MGRPNYIVVNGIRDTVLGHCARFDISHNTLSSRMKNGMTYEQALTTPMKKNRKVKYRGHEILLSEALRKAGITKACFDHRTKVMGLSDEDALEYGDFKHRLRKLAIQQQIEEQRPVTRKVELEPQKLYYRKPTFTKPPRVYFGKSSLPFIQSRLKELDTYHSHAIAIAQMRLFEEAA